MPSPALLLLVLGAAVAAAGPAPSLFTKLPDGEVAAASAIDVATAFPGVDVVKLAGSDAPALKTTGINRAVLAAQLPRLQLDLPNVDKPITARVRRDLSQIPARARGFGGSDVATAASTAVGGVWVGEVSGAPGPLSTVVLVTSDSGAVWGDIRYYDKQTQTIRSFKVVPETDRSQVDATVQAANAAATADLYPQLNPNRYILVEYTEPRGERKYLLPPAQATDTGAVTAAASEAADVSAAPTLLPEAAGSEATASGSDSAGGGNKRKLLQSTIAQDLLIVYTAAAAARYGGVEAMKAKAWENVMRTNKAYADSGINVQLSLVGIRQATGQ